MTTHTTNPQIIISELSNIEKELAELIEEEITEDHIAWDQIAARASPLLLALLERAKERSHLGIDILVQQEKRQHFRLYREHVRRLNRQKMAKATARQLFLQNKNGLTSQANTVSTTAIDDTHVVATAAVTPDENNINPSKHKAIHDEQGATEASGGGSLSTLTHEVGEDGSLSDEDLSTKIIQPTSFDKDDTSNHATEYDDEPDSSIDKSMLTLAEMDLAVLMAEWRRMRGHRRFDFREIISRSSNELRRVHVQRNGEYTRDVVKSIVRMDILPLFHDFRKQALLQISKIIPKGREGEPLTVQQRKGIIQQCLSQPQLRSKRKALLPSDIKHPPLINDEKEAKEEDEDDDDDNFALDRTHANKLGLFREEEELARLLEQIKMEKISKGVWVEVERRASAALLKKIQSHKSKATFSRIPLRFLVRRSFSEIFRMYRKKIRKKLEGMGPFEVVHHRSKVGDQCDESYATDDSVQESPKRMKLDNNDQSHALTDEYKELAELAIKYDNGKEGIWVDIFANASPHLQVMLRMKTPRTPSSPPESLVPLELRPTFREYCSVLLSRLHIEGATGENDDTHEASRKEINLVNSLALLPFSRVSSNNSVTNALQRQRRRLDMMFSTLETDMEGFARQEEAILENEGDATKGDGDALQQLLNRLRSDLLSFREQEEKAFHQRVKEYRHLTLQQPQKSASTLESMLNIYFNKQGERVDAFLIHLHATFET